MTTDPGDLVLDPTCGSGTTAFVAEQWGRRWITMDTSRIALNIAKKRLTTAVFPYYELFGDDIRQGQYIANVGPKYVETKSYTTYKDSTGKTTNGATTGPHLHFAISKNGKKIDPQTLYN